jgi:hypothetical protein
MTEEQEKMLIEVHQMLGEFKSDYKEFKSTTGFDPSDKGGCPKLS